MDSDALNALFEQVNKKDLKSIKKLIEHVQDLRNLVLELSEGLEYPSLQEQVNEVMGPIFDIENEDDENEDDD